MLSLARFFTAIHGVPVTWQTHGCQRVVLSCRIGEDEQADIVGIIRDRQTSMEVDQLGDMTKQERCSVVVCADELSPFGGIADPQLKSVWEMRDEGGDATTWAVDPTPGRGIESLSGSMAVIHLVRSYGVAKAGPATRLGRL